MIIIIFIAYIVLTAPFVWCGYTGHSWIYHFKDKYNNQCYKCQDNYINSPTNLQP